MHLLLHRKSMVSQTVDTLLKGIRDGVWREHLPGEHALCAPLQINLTTVRAALAKLARPGRDTLAQRKSLEQLATSLKRDKR